MKILEAIENTQRTLKTALADMIAEGVDDETVQAVAEIIDEMRDAILIVKHPGVVWRMPCYVTASGVHAAMKGDGLLTLCGEVVAFDQRVGFSNRCPSCEKCIEVLRERINADSSIG